MLKPVLAAVGGAMVLAVQAMPAVADNADVLVEECGKQLNLGPKGCACIGERSASLNDKQQQLVVAMVTKDQAASAKLRGSMTVDEMTGAAQFMMSAPQLCAGQ